MPSQSRLGLPTLHDVTPVFDASLFCGNYTFRKLPCDTPDSLSEFIRVARIKQAVLTPFESIFYRQPLDGLKPWLDATLDAPFQPLYWLVVNPAAPGWERDLATVADSPAVAGVRLFPRYHGYALDHTAVAEVAAAAAEFSMPVNLTARLLDDRLHPYPLHADAPLQMPAVEALVEKVPAATWLLSFFTMAELGQLKPLLLRRNDVFVDIGCSKPFELWGHDIRALGPLAQVVYGTGAPLYYHLGNRLSFERAGFSADEKLLMLSGNLQTMLGMRLERENS